MAKNTGKRKPTKRKHRKVLFLVCFFAVAVGLVCGLSVTVFFPVKNIEVSGSNIYEIEDVISASGITEEDNLLILNKGRILSNIQNKLPFVEDIELKRKLPETAVLKVKDVNTYLCFVDESTTVRTDASLRIIPEGFDFAENRLTIRCEWTTDSSGEHIVLDNADSQIINAVLEVCRDRELSVEVLDLESHENIKMKIDGRFEVDFGNKYDFSGKIAQLVAMIDNIEESKSGRIDLSDWSKDNTKGYFVEADLS